MYKGGCRKGKAWESSRYKGPFHAAGVDRVGFFNKVRKAWDGFCPRHVSAVETQHTAMEELFDRKERHKRVRRDAGAVAPVPSGGGGAKNRKRKVAPVAGTSEEVRKVRRRGSSKATTSSVAKQKALLYACFPDEERLCKDDDDVSPKLDMREQRHTVMDKDELNTIVFRMVEERLAGMPLPQQNGGMSTGSLPWTKADGNSLPLVDLGCPTNRAEKHRPTAGRGWTEEAMRKARDEFLVPAVAVVFVPEVRRNQEVCL